MYQYPKNFLSVTQLIQKLIDAGMTIDSQDEAEMALTTIGYYRLKGYSFHRIDTATKKYIADMSFGTISKTIKNMKTGNNSTFSALIFC